MVSSLSLQQQLLHTFSFLEYHRRQFIVSSSKIGLEWLAYQDPFMFGTSLPTHKWLLALCWNLGTCGARSPCFGYLCYSCLHFVGGSCRHQIVSESALWIVWRSRVAPSLWRYDQVAVHEANLCVVHALHLATRVERHRSYRSRLHQPPLESAAVYQSVLLVWCQGHLISPGHLCTAIHPVAGTSTSPSALLSLLVHLLPSEKAHWHSNLWNIIRLLHHASAFGSTCSWPSSTIQPSPRTSAWKVYEHFSISDPNWHD